jgi:hypothetical protein
MPRRPREYLNRGHYAFGKQLYATALSLKTGQIQDIDKRNEGIARRSRHCAKMRAQGCAEYT